MTPVPVHGCESKLCTWVKTFASVLKSLGLLQCLPALRLPTATHEGVLRLKLLCLVQHAPPGSLRVAKVPQNPTYEVMGRCQLLGTSSESQHTLLSKSRTQQESTSLAQTHPTCTPTPLQNVCRMKSIFFRGDFLSKISAFGEQRQSNVVLSSAAGNATITLGELIPVL